MQSPLEVSGLSKIYNIKEAVKNVSFKVNRNEIIGLLGPNGCGKTTTIAMILGLLKPTTGKVLINGTEMESQRVNLLSQLNFISPYVELPKKLTVKQNLEVYGRLYDIKNLKTKIDYLTEKLKLHKIINKITGELSSGQKNKVSLAKSIINDPLVLLLDEPNLIKPALTNKPRVIPKIYKLKNTKNKGIPNLSIETPNNGEVKIIAGTNPIKVLIRAVTTRDTIISLSLSGAINRLVKFLLQMRLKKILEKK